MVLSIRSFVSALGTPNCIGRFRYLLTTRIQYPSSTTQEYDATCVQWRSYASQVLLAWARTLQPRSRALSPQAYRPCLQASPLPTFQDRLSGPKGRQRVAGGDRREPPETDSANKEPRRGDGGPAKQTIGGPPSSRWDSVYLHDGSGGSLRSPPAMRPQPLRGLVSENWDPGPFRTRSGS